MIVLTGPTLPGLAVAARGERFKGAYGALIEVLEGPPSLKAARRLVAKKRRRTPRQPRYPRSGRW